MTRILLAPVLDQDLLGPGHRVARGLEAREPAGDDAAVARCARRRGAPVGEHAWRAPARRNTADRRIVGVEDVDVRVRRKAGVEGEAEQAPIPEVVHVRAQVGEDGRSRVGEIVEDLDQPALLGHEDTPVGREPDDGGIGEAAEDNGLLETARKRGRVRRRRDEQQERAEQHNEMTPQAHPTRLLGCRRTHN